MRIFIRKVFAHFRSRSLLPSPYTQFDLVVLHLEHGVPPEHPAFALLHWSQACDVLFFLPDFAVSALLTRSAGIATLPDPISPAELIASCGEVVRGAPVRCSAGWYMSPKLALACGWFVRPVALLVYGGYEGVDWRRDLGPGRCTSSCCSCFDIRK